MQPGVVWSSGIKLTDSGPQIWDTAAEYQGETQGCKHGHPTRL